MEIWDAYYNDGTPAGCDLIRGEQIADGLYHLVSQIVVRHTDGDFLVMQRDFNKPIQPGKLEVTAGGSVKKGENPFDGACRELFEETGIIANKLNFEFSQISDEMNTIYYNYFCVADCDKSSITLQKGETISFKWFSYYELINSLKEFPEIYCDKTLERLKQFSEFKYSGL